MPPKPLRLIALSSVIHVPHHPIKQMDQFVTGNFGQFRAGHDFCPVGSVMRSGCDPPKPSEQHPRAPLNKHREHKRDAESNASSLERKQHGERHTEGSK